MTSIIRESDLTMFSPVIEDGDKMEVSMFRSVYQNVSKELNMIIKAQKDNNKKKQEIIFKKQKNEPNIIMLNGDRGSGKTSCMISIVNQLVRFDKGERYKPFEKIDVDKFITLELIDPSEFQEESNILHIIIGELFKNFKDKVEDQNFIIEQGEKRELLKKFEEIFELIKLLSKGEKINGESELDHLIGIAEALKLSDNINKLIEMYLKAVHKAKYESIKLIIPIDDMDLNSNYAYQMLEQIRRHFMVSNVVFIIASKLEQLKLDIKQSYGNNYEKALKEKIIKSSDLDEMASKYIEKLIPASRRVSLPTLYDVMELDTLIELEKQEQSSSNESSIENKKSLEDYLLKKVYDKTRMYFKKGKVAPCRIAPENLREFGNLVNMLSHMDSNSKNHVENRRVFERYFLNSWIPTHLGSIKEKLILEIYSKSPKEKNKFTVQTIEETYSLKEKFSVELGGKDQRKETRVKEIEYLSVIEKANYEGSVSLGDVLFAINFADQYSHFKEDKDFLFAVRTIYSFLLFDYYKKKEEEAKRGELFKRDNYDLLINGIVKNVALDRFFNLPPSFTVQKDTNFTQYSTTQRYINIALISKLFKETVLGYILLKGISDKENDYPKWNEETNKREIEQMIIEQENYIRDRYNEIINAGEAKPEHISKIEDCGVTILLVVIEAMLTMIVDQTSGLRSNEREKYRIYTPDFGEFNNSSLLDQKNKYALWDINGHLGVLYSRNLKTTPQWNKYSFGSEGNSIHQVLTNLLGDLSLENLLKFGFGKSEEEIKNKRFYVGNVEAIEELNSSLAKKLTSSSSEPWVNKICNYLEALTNCKDLSDDVYESFSKLEHLVFWKEIFHILKEKKLDCFIGGISSPKDFIEQLLSSLEWQDINILKEKTKTTSAGTQKGLSKVADEMIEAIRIFENNNEAMLDNKPEIKGKLDKILDDLTRYSFRYISLNNAYKGENIDLEGAKKIINGLKIDLKEVTKELEND